MTHAFGACSVDGCDRTGRVVRGMCMAHYTRLRKYGDPKGGGCLKGEPMAFYRDVVLKYEGDDCLIWPFARLSNGYASLFIDGRSSLVHRKVCAERHGPPPTLAHEAAHSCGKGHEGCTAKSHLDWKTPAENTADKIAHGTLRRGEQAPGARLTTEQVVRIKRLLPTRTNAQLATIFDVDAALIRHIRNGTSWAWLNADAPQSGEAA